MSPPDASPLARVTAEAGPSDQVDGRVLAERYDAVLVDLDGVIYRGDGAIPAAVAALPEVRRLGARVLFITNNSARTPAQVAEKLRGLGVEADAGDVLTSALATAAMLRREGTAGRSAFVIGERGVREALEQAGIELVNGEPERADLVVVGWDRDVDYAKLRTAALLVERGARLVATNADASYPAPDGLWPGAGAILAAITTTTGARPVVVGKPARPLFEAAAEATGARHPLVVGDRLDTDVGGAVAMGWDSLLVLTGAARPPDLLSSSSLPTYVAPDLSALLEARPPARLRPAEEADVPDLLELLASAGLRTDGVGDRLGRTIVARGEQHPTRILATACLDEVKGTEGASRFGILRSVAVRADVRGRGLGQLVTAGAVAAGRARGVSRMFLLTETAEEFFGAMGFQAIDRNELPAAVAQAAHAAEECPTATVMTVAVAPN